MIFQVESRQKKCANVWSRRISAIALFVCLPLNMGFIDKLRSEIKSANQAYADGDYESALKSYMDIQVEHPGEPILDYNIGNTLYQQKRYDEAVEHYEKVLLNAEGGIQAQAQYNIGNSIYQQGLQAESTGNLQEAVEKMKSALEYYKQALRQSSDDQDIKYNIEFVQNEIKRILDKAKEQAKQQQQGEQQQQENQQQQGEQNQQQQAQQGQKQDQPQNEKQGQQGQENKQENENDGQAQPIAQEQENDGTDRQGEKKQQKKGQELTKDEAEKILKNLPEPQKKQKEHAPRRGYLGEVEQNW
ncbi:tetratricopeptide repeat protein [bacterium]|nr:tetratricopeptide repeat protein [bacterium]